MAVRPESLTALTRRGRPTRAEAPSIPSTIRLSPNERELVLKAANANRQKFNEFARDVLLIAAEDCLEGNS